MAILQVLLATIFRSLGKILNTAFGWATMLLFGKVSDSRQIYLSVIAFASVIWMVAALGVALPRVGAFLLAFVSLPESPDPNWIRLAMLVLALALPLAIGVVGLFLVEPARRPTGWAMARAVFKGYLYTLGLAVTLVLLLVSAPVLKLRDLLKWWSSTHIPVVVESRHYFSVVEEIEKVLRKGGRETTRTRCSWLLRWPTRVLTFCVGGPMEGLVADELTVLRGSNFEVLLHPSDLVVRGRDNAVARIRMLLTEHLTFTRAYLTWSKEAHEIEDALTLLWRKAKMNGPNSRHFDEQSTSLADIRRKLNLFNGTYEEWEVLYREELVVECRLLQLAVNHSENEHRILSRADVP